MIVCITGDIDYFDTESFECLESYFSALESCKVTGTFFITAKAAEENPERVEQGVKKITLNQKVIPGNFIPVEELLSVNEITVTMGK